MAIRPSNIRPMDVKADRCGPPSIDDSLIDDLLTRRNGQRRLPAFIKLQIARSPNRQSSNSPNRQSTKSANHHRPWGPPKAGRAGTSTRRSTTGRTPHDGRQDVRFWQDLARREGGPVLELGCGTGRLTMPVARTGAPVWAWIDRARCSPTRRPRAKAARRARPRLVLGDIRHLPFRRSRFSVVMAPYGMLQSLTNDRDLSATLTEAARVLRRGAVLGIDLVPDLPAWDEYENRVTFRGRNERTGAHVTLLETVRQDRRRRLTLFDQEVRGRRGSRTADTFLADVPDAAAGRDGGTRGEGGLPRDGRAGRLSGAGLGSTGDAGSSWRKSVEAGHSSSVTRLHPEVFDRDTPQSAAATRAGDRSGGLAASSTRRH